LPDEALLESQVTDLYNSSAKELYNLALYSVGNQPLAEQLAIDAFVSAYNRLPDKSDVTQFQIKSAGQLYRKTKEMLNKGIGEPDKYESIGLANDKNRINALLTGLNYDERFLLLLFSQQRFSAGQIAQILRVPKLVVRKRFCRVINKAMKVWAE
jgi:RNA polymerase sigma-70 factor (ECF subfamily)